MKTITTIAILVHIHSFPAAAPKTAKKEVHDAKAKTVQVSHGCHAPRALDQGSGTVVVCD